MGTKPATVVWVLLLTLFLGICVQSSPASDRWWKNMFSGSPSSPSALTPSWSSILLPLHGNVYPNGVYYVQLNIGQPPKPFFLDLDTGSDLTWLLCDAPPGHCTKGPHPLYVPSTDVVPRTDPLCASLHSSKDYIRKNSKRCEYEVRYADGSSSRGFLLRDNVSLNLTNGKCVTPRLAIGCGFEQNLGTSYNNHHPLDGVLGLGKGKLSIISQLRNQSLVHNVVGHCLSSHGGGFLFFGDNDYDPSPMVWTPMSSDHSKHYSPGLAELILGGRATGQKNLRVLFDSGSSYSYLNSKAYQAFVSSLRKELNGKPLTEDPNDHTLSLCWKSKQPFKSIKDVVKYFKPLALSFSSGRGSKSEFEIPPESYLIISSKRNVCLGILNGTEAELEDYNIIGDISMQDKMVIYDNERHMIGWTSSQICDQLPITKSSSV